MFASMLILGLHASFYILPTSLDKLSCKLNLELMACHGAEGGGSAKPHDKLLHGEAMCA